MKKASINIISVNKIEEGAYNYITAICAKREICSSMARELLQRFFNGRKGTKSLSKVSDVGECSGQGGDKAISEYNAVIEGIIEKLKCQKFIDDNRFITSFVRYKIEFDGWGPKKIENKLLEYNFSKEQIDSHLYANAKLIAQKREELIERKEKESAKTSSKLLSQERGKIEKKIEKLSDQIELYKSRLDEIKSADYKQYMAEYKKYVALKQKVNSLEYSLSTIEKKVALSQKKKLLSFLLSRGFDIS